MGLYPAHSHAPFLHQGMEDEFDDDFLDEEEMRAEMRAMEQATIGGGDAGARAFFWGVGGPVAFDNMHSELELMACLFKPRDIHIHMHMYLCIYICIYIYI